MVLKTINPYPLFKKGAIVLLLLVPLNALSQKLNINEYDKNTKKWRIETLPVNLKSTPNITMDLSFTSADTSFFLQLKGSGIGTNTIDVNSQVIFFLDNESTVTAKSPSVQSLDYGNASPTYRHEYVLSFEDLEKLSRHNLKALRKYSLGGFDDINIDKDKSGKVRELSNLFIAELRKNVIPAKPTFLPPGFPGGNYVFLNFLNRNLKPITELLIGEQKTVVVQFLVTTDGSINNLLVKQSGGLSFDNELLRILKRMPKWKPALKNEKQIDSMVTKSITFNRTDALLEIQF